MQPILANVTQFIDSLQHLAGMAFVLFVIVALWVFCELVGMVFKRLPQPTPAGSPLIPPPAGDQEDETVVVIAAALAMVTHQKYRIVSIKGTNPDWSREGRREHFASHKIR